MYCVGDEALGCKSHGKIKQNSDGRRAISKALSFADFTFLSRPHFRGFRLRAYAFNLFTFRHVMIKVFWIIRGFLRSRVATFFPSISLKRLLNAILGVNKCANVKFRITSPRPIRSCNFSPCYSYLVNSLKDFAFLISFNRFSFYIRARVIE